ncbi:hypothetical protein COOONC_05649 [Cooperia oncophora]
MKCTKLQLKLGTKNRKSSFTTFRLSKHSCFQLILSGDDKLKSIYRSLIIISLTVVLGYFATSCVLFVSAALQLNINMFYLSQFASLFVNLSTSVNFFVYYAISSEYRRIFDEHLGIGRLKKRFFSDRERVAVQQAANSPSSFRLSFKGNALSDVVT